MSYLTLFMGKINETSGTRSKTNHILFVLTNTGLLLLVCLLLHCANHLWLLTFVAVFSLYLVSLSCVFFSCLALLSIICRLFFLWLQLLPMRWREVSLLFSLSLMQLSPPFLSSLISCALPMLPMNLIFTATNWTCCMQSCSMLTVHVLDVQADRWVSNLSSQISGVILLSAFYIHVITMIKSK